MKKFTLIQKLRNKIRVKGTLNLDISKKAKLVGCSISSFGKNNTLLIDDEVVIRDTELEILGDNCTLSISKNCVIGRDCYLSVKDGTKLSIGDNCMFSRNVKIMTSDGHPIYKDKTIINKSKNITIKNNVWLADNVTILKGVEIGDGSVVGINSTLTKSIASNVIAVGNPAKAVKDGIVWVK